jgi:RNA polymerase sigma-70 factor (ECF subfamily)
VEVSEPPDFASFYAAELRPVLRFLYKQGAGWDECWDAAQEAFYEALRHWENLHSPRSWVRTTALRYHVRQCERRIDELRRMKSAGSWLPRPSFADIQLKDDEARVLAAIAALPQRQREVMAWHYDGYSPREIAHLLGIQDDAVRSNLYQARKTLKAGLSVQPEGGCHER